MMPSMKNNDTLFIIFAIITLGLAYTATDIYLPALPNIQHYFSASINQAQYTLTSYLLGLAIAQVIAGPIIDHLGYRKMLLPNLLFFIIVTCICAMANSIIMLIIARALQALSVGVVAVIARASFIKRFTADRAAYILTTFGPFLALSGAIAPVVGGFIAHYSNWRGVFIFLALYSGIVLWGVSRYFHVNETRQNDSSLRLLYIIKTYYQILQYRQFMQCLLINGMALGVLFAYIAEVPFIYHVAGYSARAIGLAFIPLAIGFLTASQLSRFWYGRLAMGQFVWIATLFLIVGLAVAMIPVFYPNSLLPMTLGIAMVAFGLGFSTPVAFGKATTLFPQQAGYAASVLTALPFIFSTLLTIIVHPLCGNNVGALVLFLGVIAAGCIAGYWLLK